MRTAFRSITVVLGSLLLGATLGGGVGYVMMTTMPCRWFGSGFEGACGYGALWVSIGVGSLIAIVTAAVLIIRYFSTSQAVHDAADSAAAVRGPTRELVIWWRVLFVLSLLLSLTPWLAVLAGPESPFWFVATLSYGPVGGALVWLLRILHAGFCVLVARSLDVSPPAAGIVALLGAPGAIVSHGYLSVRMRRNRAIPSGAFGDGTGGEAAHERAPHDAP